MKTKAMGKITVRHYLNTNLKPYIIDGDKLYRLYFLLRYQNKNTKMKSLIDVELTEKEYNQKIKDKNDILNQRIKNETKLIEKVISLTDKMNYPFEIKLFRDVWDVSTYPIIEKFEKKIILQNERAENYRDLSSFQTRITYEKVNIETYYNVLKTLKMFVSKSKHSITDELFLIHFFDKEIMREYKKSLGNNEKYHTIFTPEEKFQNDAIQTTYKESEIDNIEIIRSCLFEDSRYPFFFQSPKIQKMGIFEIDKHYFQEIAGLVIGG